MELNPFDEKATTWDDDPAKVERARRVAELIVSELPVAPTWRVLDYGAGTGLVSHALATAVGDITLADSSTGMRAVIERKIADGQLPNSTVWSLDLAIDPVPPERFDLIVTVMALHHISDLDRTLAAFAAMLAPGGYLAVVDLDAENGSFHQDAPHHGASIPHHGFDRGALAQAIEATGLCDVRMLDCGAVKRDNGTFTTFLAIGQQNGVAA